MSDLSAVLRTGDDRAHLRSIFESVALCGRPPLRGAWELIPRGQLGSKRCSDCWTCWRFHPQNANRAVI